MPPTTEPEGLPEDELPPPDDSRARSRTAREFLTQLQSTIGDRDTTQRQRTPSSFSSNIYYNTPSRPLPVLPNRSADPSTFTVFHRDTDGSVLWHDSPLSLPQLDPPPTLAHSFTPTHGHLNEPISTLRANYPHNRSPLRASSDSVAYIERYRNYAPPQILHKVFRLSCASCHTFFTNRGMRAVLLLCPNIHLYSTDAMPANCSSPPASSMPKPCPSEPPAQRTCDCLTQTLCCHGCGNQCGYAIVAPCLKCSSTGTPAHNGANGHRFVFHQSEICATERRYVQGEPDIIQEHPNLPYAFTGGEHHQFRSNEGTILSPSRQLHSILTSPTLLSGDDHIDEFDSSGEDEEEEDEYKAPSPSMSPSPSRDLPGARSEAPQGSFLSISTSSPSSASMPQEISNSPPTIYSTPSRPTRPYRSPDPLFFPTNNSAPPTQCNRLCHGDIVWWHNLKHSGDIFGVSEEYAQCFDLGTADNRMKLLRKSLRALR